MDWGCWKELFSSPSPRAHLVDEEIEVQMTSHGHTGHQRREVYTPNRLTLNTAFLQNHAASPRGWTLKLSMWNTTPLLPPSWL